MISLNMCSSSTSRVLGCRLKFPSLLQKRPKLGSVTTTLSLSYMANLRLKRAVSSVLQTRPFPT